MTIQDRIRERRRQLGISMQDVAASCGVSWQAVQRWETTAAPKRNNLLALADRLKVSIEWLMTGKGPLNQHAAVDFSKLSGQEAQLVMFFRSMNEPDKEEFLAQANMLAKNSQDQFGAVLMKAQAPNSPTAKRKKIY